MLRLIKPKKYICTNAALRFAQRIAARNAGRTFYEGNDSDLIFAYGVADSGSDLLELLRLLSAVLGMYNSKLQFSAYRKVVNLRNIINVYVYRNAYRSSHSELISGVEEIYNTLLQEMHGGVAARTFVREFGTRVGVLIDRLESAKTVLKPNTVQKSRNIYTTNHALLQTMGGNMLKLMARSIAHSPQIRREAVFLQILKQNSAVLSQRIEARQSAVKFLDGLTETQRNYLDQFIVTKDLFHEERKELGFSQDSADVAVLLPYASSKARRIFFHELQQELHRSRLTQQDMRFLFSNRKSWEQFLVNVSEETFLEYIETLQSSSVLSQQDISLMKKALYMFREKNLKSRQEYQLICAHYSHVRETLQEYFFEEPKAAAAYFKHNCDGRVMETYVDFLMNDILPALDTKSLILLQQYLRGKNIFTETEPEHNNIIDKQSTYKESFLLFKEKYPEEMAEFITRLTGKAVTEALPFVMRLFNDQHRISDIFTAHCHTVQNQVEKISEYLHENTWEKYCSSFYHQLQILPGIQAKSEAERYAVFFLSAEESAVRKLITSIESDSEESETIRRMLSDAESRIVSLKSSFNTEISAYLSELIMQSGEAYGKEVSELIMELARRECVIALPEFELRHKFWRLIQNEYACTRIGYGENPLQKLRSAVMLERFFGLETLQKSLVSYDFSSDVLQSRMKQRLMEAEAPITFAFAEAIVHSVQNDNIPEPALISFAEELEQILYADGAYGDKESERQIRSVFSAFIDNTDSIYLQKIYSSFFSENSEEENTVILEFLRFAGTKDMFFQRELLSFYAGCDERISRCCNETVQFEQLHDDLMIQYTQKMGEDNWQIVYPYHTALEDAAYESFHEAVCKLYELPVREMMLHILKLSCEDNAILGKTIISQNIIKDIISSVDETMIREGLLQAEEIDAVSEHCNCVLRIKEMASQTGLLQEYESIFGEISAYLTQLSQTERDVSCLNKYSQMHMTFLLSNSTLINALSNHEATRSMFSEMVSEAIDKISSETAWNILTKIQPEHLTTQQFSYYLQQETQHELQMLLADLDIQAETTICNIIEKQLSARETVEISVYTMLHEELTRAYEKLEGVYEENSLEFNRPILNRWKEYVESKNDISSYESLINQCSAYIEKSEGHIQEKLRSFVHDSRLYQDFITEIWETPEQLNWLKQETTAYVTQAVRDEVTHESVFTENFRSAVEKQLVRFDISAGEHEKRLFDELEQQRQLISLISISVKNNMEQSQELSQMMPSAFAAEEQYRVMLQLDNVVKKQLLHTGELYAEADTEEKAEASMMYIFPVFENKLLQEGTLFTNQNLLFQLKKYISKAGDVPDSLIRFKEIQSVRRENRIQQYLSDKLISRYLQNDTNGSQSMELQMHELQYTARDIDGISGAESLHFALPPTAGHDHKAKLTEQTAEMQKQLEHINKKIDVLEYQQKSLAQEAMRHSDYARLKREFTKQIENDIYMAGKRHGMLP